jgi:ABC-type phosphate/phosphonate transport system substrate-binding protein
MQGREALPPEPVPDGKGLRFLTYLAPGLPLELFQAIASHVGRELGLATTLAYDPTRSAPEPGSPDPFSTGRADVGFLCAPSYLWLSERVPPVVELLPAAFQFDDPRCQGGAVYFAELIGPRTCALRSLEGLRGARWVYNDPCSLSGYFSVLAALGRLGRGVEHFSGVRAIGSHHAALRAVAAGEADCAAIDSNMVLHARRSASELVARVRVLESFGPHPVQPIVVRASLGEGLKRALANALLGMHALGHGRRALLRHGVRRLAPVSREDYQPERALLRACAPAGRALAALP